MFRLDFDFAQQARSTNNEEPTTNNFVSILLNEQRRTDNEQRFAPSTTEITIKFP
ncbi:MAG: hypothetical protein ACKV1O_06330 [Saprospiraceae bacterium]